MAQHIAEMIHRGNPQAIEKYVKNHLPADTASLERIYKQLLEYKPGGEAKRANKLGTKSHSVTSLTQKNIVVAKKDETIPIEKKRTQNLIKMLREKGFKPNNADEQQGLCKYRSHMQRLTKPHITNSKLLRSEQAVIDRLINRYAINSKYYNNDIQDVKLDLDTNLDPDMRQFLGRRNSILESFKNKTNNNSTNYSKFTSVTCRVYERATSRTSFEKMPSMKDTASTIRRLSPTKKLMEECTEQIKEQKYKEVKPNQNYYRQIKQKIQREFDEQGDQNSEEMTNFKHKLQKLQFQRYTNTYMKMMNNKIKEGSKCKLSSYAKDLLRDERKMRNIIDFSNK